MEYGVHDFGIDIYNVSWKEELLEGKVETTGGKSFWRP